MHHRQERRTVTRKAVVATILGRPDVSVRCEIANYSRSGMSIIVGREIPEGNAVKVDWDDHFLVGRVRRVAPEGTEYQVGLELLYCSEWKDGVESATVN